MSDYILFIPIFIILIIVVILVICLRKNSKSNEESTSILDVNSVGVPSSSEFSYGYEKEATIVMDPVSKEEIVEKQPETKEENENIEVKKESEEEKFPDVSEDDILDITTTIKKDKEREE